MAKIVPYEAESKQAVLQEYDILKSLHHDRIMALHEAYVTPRYLVLIAEYCSGKELLYSLIDRSVLTSSGSSGSGKTALPKLTLKKYVELWCLGRANILLSDVVQVPLLRG